MDTQNQSRPCYLLTRKGCDLVANKMTGEKGVLFTATYVTRFEEMEKVLTRNGKHKISPNSQTLQQVFLNTIQDPGFKELKAPAQNTVLKELAKEYFLKFKQEKQKQLTAIPYDTQAYPEGLPDASDLLKELLSHAVHINQARPMREKEVKTSILYDDDFYYIFPAAIDKYLPGMYREDARKTIYKEIKSMRGVPKIKKVKYFNTLSKAFHTWVLRRAPNSNLRLVGKY
jgi:hypothetical protein